MKKNKGTLPLARFLKKLGPGLITGAADDDPSGIATYSQLGASFGFSMLWTLWASYPLMVAIQIIAAKIGRVTGRGLAGNLRLHASPGFLYSMVGLLLVANTINIGADLGIMGAVAQNLVGGPVLLYIALFGIVCALLQVWVRYADICRILKWLTLSLLAYVATVLIIKVPWLTVLRQTVWPKITWNPAYITGLVALFGTTISPYLFFWQASQEVEEQQANPSERPLLHALTQVRRQMDPVRDDTLFGMAVSNLIAFFILLTAAVVLHQHGVLDIDNPQQAAAALRPLAGRFAFVLFSLGMVGSGLLAIPVLAGSSAYGVAEAMHWPTGLDRQPGKAVKFYAVIVVATLTGIAMNGLGIGAMKALYWSAIVNGIIAVPIIYAMLSMASKPAIMGQLVIGPVLRLCGWFTLALMAACVVGMIVSLLLPYIHAPSK